MSMAIGSVSKLRWQVMFFIVLAVGLFVFNYQESHRYDDVRNVSVGEAKVMIDAGALVIDVRGESAFQKRHIPGAINIPLAILESGIPASIASAISKPVVVYCGDGVTIGPHGTQLLNDAGYKQAANIQGGLDGWTKAGLPIQS